MIVREILEDPFKVVSIFDWFNDYRDTWQFLRRMNTRRADLIGDLLDAGYKLYHALK